MGVPVATVFQRFHEILGLIKTTLKWIMKYLDREELQKTIPRYDVEVVALVYC